MKILLCNDDGVNAEGIEVLAKVLSEIADIVIVAPDRNRSGASNSLTLDAPLHVTKLKSGAYSVEGTPTDCVHLALRGLFKDDPDMVVSGINERANMGDDILYSGTVAAAIEGRYLGTPAIAVSLAGNPGTHYETAARVTKQIVQHINADPLPAGTILNINVPDVTSSNLKGYEVTRLGTRNKGEKIIEYIDPRGRKCYWIGATGTEQDAGPGTDFYALTRDKVSITPLQVDFTNYKAFDQIADWLNGLKK